MFHVPFVAALGAAVMTAAASAQLSFAPTANIPVGAQPGGVATGDFDGDGDIDLATGIQAPSRVITLINDGNANFTPGPIFNFANGTQPEEVVAGDFDGNGTVDLAILLRGLLQVRIMLNQGGLVFVDAGSAPIGANGRGMDVADHDGDGDLDLAVANRGSNTATVLTNNGSGGFTSATLSSPGEPRAASFGDYDGDGDLDLGVTNNDAFNVRLFRNDAGVFTSWQVLPMNPNQAEGIDSKDVDQDGDVDIVAGAEDDNVGVSNAVVYLNAGGGAFGPATSYATSGIASSGARIADFNCDGAMDLVIGNEDSGNVSFLTGDNSGAFATPVLRSAGLTPETIAVADMDGDALMDVITANRDSGTLSIILNRTCLAADLDGDGRVAFLDLVELLAYWGDCIDCRADFDGDGHVGMPDLMQLLSNWTG